MRFTAARWGCLRTDPSVLISDINSKGRAQLRWDWFLEWSGIQDKWEEGVSEQEQLFIKSPYLVQCTKIPYDCMDQELSVAGKCICDPWQKPRRVQFCRVASEGQEEDSLLFTFLLSLQRDCYPRICSKDIRRSLDKEQHLYQEWWNLPLEKSD